MGEASPPPPDRGGPPLVWTDTVENLAGRALAYLSAGYGLVLRGPSGTGKTVLAEALAERRGGTVLRLDSHTPRDAFATLTLACAEGATVIVDPVGPGLLGLAPPLAAVLAERVLPLSAEGGARLAVHPGFRAILVAASADALPPSLADLLVTIDCEGHDRETEIAIAAAHAGLGTDETARIVDMVRDVRRSREYAERPSLRCSIMLCRLVSALGCDVTPEDPRFVSLVLDVLGARLRHGPDGLPEPKHRQMLVKLIGHFCGERPRAPAVAA